MTDNGGTPGVVVVANPNDAAELTELLESVGCAVAWSGDGGDATLQRIREQPPGVVVLSAHLDQGDARSLAAAARAEPGPIGIVLVGETDGPVRNALDAIDFSADRFVGRPLSAKALRFAVRTARPGALCPDTAPPAPPPKPPAKAPPTPPAVDILEQATNTAIEAFVNDAMAALPLVDNGWTDSTPSPDPDPDPDPAPDPDPDPDPDSDPDPDPILPPREPTLILDDAAPPPLPPAAAPAFPRVAAPEEPTAPQPSLGSSELARELRQKMSQMAERLFPGRRDAASEALGADAHAEIDLASLDADIPRRGAIPFSEMATADTYADTALTSPGQVPAPERDSSASGSRPDLQGEIELSADSRESTDEVTNEVVHTTTRRRRGTPRGPMRGDIDARGEDIASLIARLYREEFTGRVVLARDEAEKQVHFEGGRPVFATSNLPHDRMGDLLYREGKITRGQHGRSREVVAESGRRMGEILVDMGFLKRRELLPAVRRHIEDIVYSLFAWESGDYTLIPGDAATGEKIRLSRHPAALIVEGIRRKYGIDVLEARLGGPGTVIAVIQRDDISALLKELDLGQVERRAIHHLDGERSLDEVADAADVDLLGVYQICFGLVVLGAAELASSNGADTGTWAEAVSAPSLVGATDLAIDRERLLAKHAHVEEADYFMLLGVRREASGFEIQRAYEAARRDYAAEAFPSEVRRELAAEIEEINGLLEEAYAVLRDDDMRDAYRSHLQD